VSKQNLQRWRLTENPRVGGSIPPLGTSLFSYLAAGGADYVVTDVVTSDARVSHGFRGLAWATRDMIATKRAGADGSRGGRKLIMMPEGVAVRAR